MKQIIFLRHAKSDWGNELLKDIDRHLNERGYSDAYFMSKWFAEQHKSPALILSSTASRALSTALIFARQLEFDMKHFKIEKRIYEASVSTLKKIVSEQDNSYNSIMMVGHNPGFTEVCNTLSEDLFFDNLPTCGIVSIQFKSASWQGVVKEKGKIEYYQFPKEFRKQD